MGIQNSAIADNGIQNLNLSDLLKIEFKKDSYFESQLVEGVVTFQPKQNMVFNDILIKFQQYEYFSYIIEEPNKIVSDLNTHVFFEKPMNAGYFLNAQRVQGGMFSLNPGTYKIPFQFTLPPNIPPSFEYPIKNRRAALRYIFSAQVLSPYAKTITESYLWVKARPINVPDTIKHENYITVKNVGIINRGKSGIALFTMSNNFKINDWLPFTVDIYNEDCGVQVKEVKISIKRIVTFMDKGKEYQHRTAILRRKYHCICDRNSKNTFHYDDIQIRDDEFRDVDFNRSLSPYPFLNDLNLLMPNIRSKFIKCEYSLKATSYFDLSVLGKNRPRVEMPIFITHQIQKEFEYEKNQNLNKRQQQLYSGVDLNKVENTYKPGNNKNMNNMNNNNMNRPMGNNNNNNSGNNMGNSSSNQSGSSTGGKKYSYQAYIAARNLNNPNKSQNNNNNINNNNNNNWKSNSSFQPSNNFGNNSWNNNSNPWDNNNNNPWNNNNNNNNPWDNNNNNNNPWGNNNNNYNNNNNNPWGNNNNQNNYGGGNNGVSNPFSGGNDDFPSFDNINNNNMPQNPFCNNNEPTNPFGNNEPNNPFGNNNGPNNPFGNNNNSAPSNPFGNNNNNNQPQNPFGNDAPQNPFGGNSGQGPYQSSYPGF